MGWAGWGFLGGSEVKNLPAKQKTQVWSLVREDPLQKGMATQLRYSSLGNPMDRGACRATVHGVTKESATEQQYICLFILGNWFTWSWRLVKSEIWPGMWNAGDLGRSCSSSSKASAGRIPLSLGKVSHYFIQACNWLDEAHSHYGGQSALLKVHQFKC